MKTKNEINARLLNLTEDLRLLEYAMQNEQDRSQSQIDCDSKLLIEILSSIKELEWVLNKRN